jgi:hypothetical protein
MHGGKRKGSGRKSIAEELGTKDLARNALIAKYETLDNALKKLLETGEPALVKFVFEHAFGKSPEHIDLTSKGEQLHTITGMIVK